MQDLAVNVYKNNVRYLHGLSELLEHTPSNVTLKTYYLTKSTINEIKGSAYLPRNLSNETFCCQKCRIYRTDDKCIVNIKPAQRLNRFTKRLLKKQKNSINLSRYQQKALKRLKNVGCNAKVLTCKVCKSKSETYMNKPVKVEPKVKKKLVLQTPKKNKKKKKDKFAGLNPMAVLAATPQKLGQRTKSMIVPELKIKQVEKEKLRVKMKQKGQLNNILNKSSEQKRTSLSDFLKTV